jgi:uncharacterized repeat protein (TIGR03803 family)
MTTMKDSTLFALGFALFASFSLRAGEFVMQTLHETVQPPDQPRGRLVAAVDGGFLGTSLSGGRFNLGTVYQVTSDGQLLTLVSFNGTNGSRPLDLIRAHDGAIYGSTDSGGENGTGVVFKYEPGGTIAVLAAAPKVRQTTREDFGRSLGGYSLFEGLDGNLYGTWASGSPTNFTNVIFRLSPTGTLTTFAKFDGSNGSTVALAQSSHASDYGTIYGATLGKDFQNPPTLFQVSGVGNVSAIHTFEPYSTPVSYLVRGSDGRVHGVQGTATVFIIAPDPQGKGFLVPVVSFPAPTLPDTTVSLMAFEPGSDGTFLGATGLGFGPRNEGDFSDQIFSLSAEGTFNRIGRALPDCDACTNSPICNLRIGALVQAPNGVLYGTTRPIAIWLFTCGARASAFQMSPSGEYKTLATFGDLQVPRLTEEGSDGSFYGLGSGGRYGAGTIIHLTREGKATTLASFNYGANGERPQGLFLAKDGNRYGFTSDGGPTGWGTIFTLTPDGALTTLFPPAGIPGGTLSPFTNATPISVVEGIDGNLYCTVSITITKESNVIKLTPRGDMTELTRIGDYPVLIGRMNDSVFGMSNEGSGPTVFKLTPPGTVSTFFKHPKTNTWFYNLLPARDGNLYGTLFERHGQGTPSASFFRLTPTGVFTELSTSQIIGRLEYRELFEGTDGNFYGTARSQDTPTSEWSAEILRITPEGTVSTLTRLRLGQSWDGPYLIQSRDGVLYGTLQTLTPEGISVSGMFFRLVPQPSLRVALSGGDVNLTWNSLKGGVYRIEYKTLLNEFDWRTMSPDVTAMGDSASLTDNPAAASQRYYRVRLLP